MKIQILDAETFSYDNKTVVLRCKGCGLLFGFWATKEVGTVDMLRECPACGRSKEVDAEIEAQK